MKLYSFIIFVSIVCFASVAEAGKFRLGSMSRNKAARFSSAADKALIAGINETNLSVRMHPSFKGSSLKSIEDTQNQVYRIISRYLDRLERKGLSKFEREFLTEVNAAGSKIKFEVTVFPSGTPTSTWGQLSRNPMVPGGQMIEVRLANLKPELFDGNVPPRLLSYYDTAIHEGSHWMDNRKQIWFGNLQDATLRKSFKAESFPDVGILAAEMKANLNALGNYNDARRATATYYKGALGLSRLHEDPTSYQWLKILTEGKLFDDLTEL
ncbi:MAG: hypothetical protein J0L93_02655 [Deltaproteobacteria bacterium]|nr:hypothetical protein [Deltaproteobacteria bacterium]